MAASILKRVCLAVKQAALEGKEWLEVYGIMLYIEHVAGMEYRAILADGGEIVRFEKCGREVRHMVTA